MLRISNRHPDEPIKVRSISSAFSTCACERLRLQPESRASSPVNTNVAIISLTCLDGFTLICPMLNVLLTQPVLLRVTYPGRHRRWLQKMAELLNT